MYVICCGAPFMWSACLSEGEFRIASSYGVGNTCAVKHAAAAAVVVVVVVAAVVASTQIWVWRSSSP